MSEQEEDRPERIPMAYRASMQQIKHTAHPPDEAKKLRELQQEYPVLYAPQIIYSNFPTKDLPKIMQRAHHAVDLTYISSRNHTWADYAHRQDTYNLLDGSIYAAREGFKQKEANTSTINQSQTNTEIKRGGRSLFPWRNKQ
jgi:hypothetical protein